MKFSLRHGSWIPILVWLSSLIFPNVAYADPTPGLNAVGYIITAIPPTRSDTVYQTCGSELENNINRNFNGEPFQQCPNDNFMVHYTGSITIPANNTISFMIAADDGGTVKIGDTEFGGWNLKGCTWSQATSNTFTAGTYTLDGWFFEATGYACYMLAWNINNTGWVIVPDSAFTQQAIVPTTTTSSSSTTTTTESPTTTSTTTSSTISPSTIASTTTTEFSTTTSSFTTILYIETTTTTTDLQPTTTTSTTTTTTTTQVPVVPSATLIPSQTTNVTTPSEQPVAVTIPETTTPLPAEQTTTTELQTPTTLPTELPTMTSVETTFTTYPSVTLPNQYEDSPSETTLPKLPQPQTPDIPQTEELKEEPPLITTIPLQTSNVATISNFVENIENNTVEELLNNVDSLLKQEPSNDELKTIFNAVFNDNLSDKETIELAQEVLKGELNAEEFGTVIDAIFDEVVTDEVLIETFTAVLETKLDEEKFEAIVNVLESEVISNEQVAEVVTLIIEQEGGVNSEQATELATSSKVLENINGEQATEVFDAVVASEVSPEDGLAIVEAVQNAPEEVKEAFEEEINVFEGVFDEYVPTGSSISVAERRAVIAATAVLFVAPLPIPTTSSSQNAASRKKG